MKVVSLFCRLPLGYSRDFRQGFRKLKVSVNQAIRLGIGHILRFDMLGVNPFNQPGVEAYKKRMKENLNK